MKEEDKKKILAAQRRFDAVSNQARETVMQKVMRHAEKHPNNPWSGAALRDLEKTIRQFYADLGLKYDKVFRETLPETMQTYYDRAVEEMKKAGKRNAILGKPDSGRIKYFLDNSMEYVAMKTQNMSFQHIKELRAMSADVFRQMSITGETRKKVSREMMNRAMKIPGFQFIDKKGTKWANKSYFSMLARTELMNAARASYEDKCAEEGFDVMKLSTSGHSCGACSRFEGRLFSLTGKTAGLPSKQDLIDAGVFHPNCTHIYSLVPDAVIERDYNADGTRKTDTQTAPFGFSFGTEKREKFVPKFNGELTPQAAELKKQMKRAGISKEASDEILWNHTRKMQELCGKNPNIQTGASWAGVEPNTANMKIGNDTGSWNGCRQTVTHEYGHYVANSIYDIQKTRSVLELETAAISDWDIIRKKGGVERFKNLADNSEKYGELQEKLANELFSKKYSELNFAEQWKIVADGDILGSISGGLYGFGHSTQVYLEDWYREAFANMYLARKYNWVEFQAKYPNLWKYIGEIIE